jgi:hypothetical protein
LMTPGCCEPSGPVNKFGLLMVYGWFMAGSFADTGLLRALRPRLSRDVCAVKHWVVAGGVTRAVIVEHEATLIARPAVSAGGARHGVRTAGVWLSRPASLAGV